MKEELVVFETAKLAKDKGFNIPVVSYYNPKYPDYPTTGTEYQSDRDVEFDWNNNSEHSKALEAPYPNNFIKGQCSAPTQSLLQNWLREFHKIYVN